MFQVGNSVDSTLTDCIVQELARRPLGVNKYRINSGEGRSQAFGIVRQRNGTYTGSRLNFERPDLYQMLLSLANSVLPPDFDFLSIQLNQNYQTAEHKDKGNRGVSCILGCGDYTGGDLVIEKTPVAIKNRLVYFNGSQYFHYTDSYEGNRISIVFFRPDKDFKDIPRFSFTQKNGKTLLVEDYKGVRRIYSQRGVIIESSDGFIPERKSRTPTLRPCEE